MCATKRDSDLSTRIITSFVPLSFISLMKLLQASNKALRKEWFRGLRCR